MIEYIVADNPDERIIRRACEFLRDGKIIVFPTDTNWIFAANLMNKKAVEAIYKIKGSDKKKHLSVICSSISQASKYANISNSAFRLINKAVPGPYTFILTPTREIPRSIKEYKKSREIGIRIPKSKICVKLIEFFDYPIITASLTSDLLKDNGISVYGDEIFSYQIEEAFNYQISMVLDPGEFHIPINGSTIIDFSNEDDVPKLLREGAGDFSLFAISRD